jgi:uncharacterized membrane protein YsdA (DUF1294 family)
MLAAIYAAMSVVTLVAYGIDKRRAILGKYRIRERTLHLLELLGGWPGAVVGQVWFRHKRRKLAYMVVFFGIIALHVAAWVGFYWLVVKR